MDRRKFIQSGSATIASVAAANAVVVTATAGGEVNDDALYEGLYSTVAAYFARHNCELDTSELPVMVNAMLAASWWARKTGITFTWRPMPDFNDYETWKHEDGLTTYYYEGAWHNAAFCFDADNGDRLWRCDARHGGRLIGFDQGWPASAAVEKTADNRLLGVYCECRLALHLLGEAGGVVFDSIRTGETGSTNHATK